MRTSHASLGVANALHCQNGRFQLTTPGQLPGTRLQTNGRANSLSGNLQKSAGRHVVAKQRWVREKKNRVRLNDRNEACEQLKSNGHFAMLRILVRQENAGEIFLP